MLQREMREILSQCKNLHELVRAANEMKQKGEDPLVVNKIFQSCRKNLVKQTAPIKRISKISFLPHQEGIKHCMFNVSAGDINAPIVQFDGDCTVII